MKIEPRIAWRTAGHGGFPLDPRVLPLLREIRARSTLRAATAAVGLSYRAAWDLLSLQTRALGTALVVMERGRGARLSPLAERLVAADDAAQAQLEPAREHLAVAIDPAAPGGALLRLVASHDPLLAELATRAHLPVELTFRGSRESVSAFAQGSAELAGFHLPPGDGGAYRELIRPRRDRLIRFARREQGLIVAADNPHGLRSLADVAQARLRFVNRQRGSGTRMLVDALLGESGVAPEALQGYADEEFTQAAVADMATGIDSSILLTYRAAWMRDVQGVKTTREAAMAKMAATETAQQVIDRAVQAFGGLGVQSGQMVERLYREIRPLRIYEGATEVQKLIIARETLRDPAGGRS